MKMFTFLITALMLTLAQPVWADVSRDDAMLSDLQADAVAMLVR